MEAGVSKIRKKRGNYSVSFPGHFHLCKTPQRVLCRRCRCRLYYIYPGLEVEAYRETDAPPSRSPSFPQLRGNPPPLPRATCY